MVYDLNANGPVPLYHVLLPIEGGPSWIGSDRYSLEAKAEGQTSQEMMRGLCCNGFSKTPLDGRPYQPGQKPLCGVGIYKKGSANMVWGAPGRTLDEFARWLGNLLDRPVRDKTEITGRFDLNLEFARDESISGFNSDPALAPAPSDPPAPSILTALQQQLGLKLEPARGTREFLVIDHIERPTENWSTDARATGWRGGRSRRSPLPRRQASACSRGRGRRRVPRRPSIRRSGSESAARSCDCPWRS